MRFLPFICFRGVMDNIQDSDSCDSGSTPLGSARAMHNSQCTIHNWENGMKENNIILEKTKSFAIRIVKVCKYLNDKNEYVLSKQLLRSGTSIVPMQEKLKGGKARQILFQK